MNITIAEGASEDTANPAAIVAAFKKFKQVVAIVAICKPNKYFALADSILDAETGGDLRPPVDVAELVDIDEDDKSSEDKSEVSHHLLEEDTKFAKIESF